MLIVGLAILSFVTASSIKFAVPTILSDKVVAIVQPAFALLEPVTAPVNLMVLLVVNYFADSTSFGRVTSLSDPLGVINFKV
jgi:hypothetical protein